MKKKQNSDPFLIQASLMLAILVTVYLFGGDACNQFHTIGTTKL